MTAETIGKFKPGDRVVITNNERWSRGCHGTIKGVWRLPKGAPYYLVGLDESTNSYIKSTYVYERDLAAE